MDSYQNQAMTTKLHVAENLALPLEAVTQTFAILAKRGVGKTHTGSVMAEEMLKLGQPIVVYDPTGAWWGLKSSADGKRPGFPVVVFGGEHADVPLEETAGSTIAGVIVEKRIPAILDCSLLRKGARVRFMTDFCEQLYHKNREALHFFVDEAHTIAPQNLKAMPESARLLGAMEDIILQGRRRGLGATIISQRPALVNKNVTTQCEVLIAMRMIGKLDRDAIQDWIDVHAEKDDAAKQMVASLASLAIGEGWVWSPGWLGIMVRVPRFRMRETFDSSATPAAGQVAKAPKAIAEIDVAKLGAEIAATVERAKADDPKELKRKIAELEKQVKASGKGHAQAVIDKAMEDARVQLDRFWRKEIADRDKQIADLSGRLYKIAKLTQVEVQLKLNTPPLVEIAARNNSARPPQPVPRQPVAVRAADVVGNDSGNYSTGKGETTILRAIAQHEAGVTREQLTVLTGYKRSSRDTYLQRLRAGGLIEQRGETIVATAAGVESLGSSFEPLPTGSALQEFWLTKLSGGERKLLQILIDNYPSDVDRHQLTESTGYQRSSRDTYLQRLRARKLITADRGQVRASDELFD